MSETSEIKDDIPNNEEILANREEIINSKLLEKHYHKLSKYSKEELSRRREIIFKIKDAKKRFLNADLENISNINLESKGLKELEKILIDTENIVRSRGSENFTQIMAIRTLKTCEALTANTRLKLQGIADICAQDQEFKNLIDELVWEYGGFKNLPVIYRLPIYLGGIAYSVHTMNMQNDMLNKYLKKEIKENINEKYKNL